MNQAFADKIVAVYRPGDLSEIFTLQEMTKSVLTRLRSLGE